MIPSYTIKYQQSLQEREKQYELINKPYFVLQPNTITLVSNDLPFPAYSYETNPVYCNRNCYYKNTNYMEYK